MMKRRARYLKRLGELLVFHRILDRANELSEASLEETVMEFQAAADLYVDGIPGPETYWALQMPFALCEPAGLCALRGGNRAGHRRL